MAAHASTRTTQLYNDRREERVKLDEIMNRRLLRAHYYRP